MPILHGRHRVSTLSERMKISAILTCFNRREKTLASLKLWFGQRVPPDVLLHAVVVDDGSSDGTGEAIRREFPQVELIQGTGSLYWCGGMRVAWQAAAVGNPDYYVLVNDDTLLEPFALEELLKAAPAPEVRRIVVGAIRDPECGEASYGGWSRLSGLIPPTGRFQDCETFTANCALIPRAVYQEMGGLHGAYTHGMGDFDYGYQAAKKGIGILQTPGFVGDCARNSWKNTWRDQSLPMAERLKRLQSPKGLPWKEWVIYNRRNQGWKWPLFAVSPVLRILTRR